MDNIIVKKRPGHVHRTGKWLPENPAVTKHWLSKLVKHVDTHPKPLMPVLQEFQDTVENDSTLHMLATGMLLEVPDKPPYNEDPTGACQVRDYKHMFQLFNHIMQTAPTWSSTAEQVGLIGFPINAILDWPMGTPSGYAFFLSEKVNEQFSKMLGQWGEYLMSPASASVLTNEPDGWFGDEAIAKLTEKGNLNNTNYTFEELYVCDPSLPHHGFGSWDDFFIRRFRPEVRPLTAPEGGPPNPDIPDPTAVIANCCESAPFNLLRNVKERDTFWLKGQPYSLVDMLAHDDITPQFIGGTVYQAFLSAESYHRWHCPVSGRVVKSYTLPGTYYSEPLCSGFSNPEGPDPAGPNLSQGYITAVATRAIIFIEAENPDIGLMCFIAVGMAEVSTCETIVKDGQQVKKGDEIGMFHFGGSTHCLIFRKGVDLVFAREPPYDLDDINLPVRDTVAVVKPNGTH
ncbi:MAG: hypothetical protein M1834_006697 [Cirrosporium novae-zelandiae]|nr:MAG: hypothetical protein M1834_006697 [Cirrosporium novae-zelandiae]